MKVRRINAVWELPSKGWVKLNFDGAAKGNPRQAGYGGIIRNDEGSILGCIAGNMGIATNNEVEAWAMARGIKLCVEQGYNMVEVEGDSQIIINAVMQQNIPNWKLQQYLDDIRQNLMQIQQYKVAHVYREANKATDWLANMGVKADRETKFIKLDGWSDDIITIVRNDFETGKRGKKKGIG
ncbi:hypothetical protein SUGI_0575960 [Cryptomeria japonica]|nr:hypothetical protein SUGI_0575960 [Cryptomeria japonica]